jgi:hypothetical protein
MVSPDKIEQTGKKQVGRALHVSDSVASSYIQNGQAEHELSFGEDFGALRCTLKANDGGRGFSKRSPDSVLKLLRSARALVMLMGTDPMIGLVYILRLESRGLAFIGISQKLVARYHYQCPVLLDACLAPLVCFLLDR